MAFRLFDYICEKCEHIEEDVMVDMENPEAEIPYCGDCHQSMVRRVACAKAPLMKGKTVSGSSPRRVEITWQDAEGRALKKENATHKLKDGNGISY